MMCAMSQNEPVTHVSSDAFAQDPKRYVDEAARGLTVEIATATLGNVVLISKEELEGYKATAELLGNPEDRAALLKSLSELGQRE
jgi:hypothetical protein